MLKACSYWNSDTLAAIVEHGCTFYNTIKCRTNSNELPQKLDIYGACINANIVFKSEGTFSYLSLQQLILQNSSDSMNTGCIVYFPESCGSCIFHKTTRSLTYFLVNFKQDQTLEMLKTNDCSSLVHSICEKTTNKVTQEEIKYPITFLSCTCDLNKVERQNILKRHKSLQQKTHITTKRRNCYAQLGSLKRKKCLYNFQQYYKDNRLHI